MKSLQKLITLLALALCGYAIHPPQARAQFLGYTSPQTTQVTLANGLACTGGPQTFTTGTTPGFDNLGQTQHYATIVPANGAATTAKFEIDGIDALGNVTRISDQGFMNSSINPITLSGSGYFPRISVVVTCTPNSGTFTLTYSGTSSTSNLNVGGYLLAQLDKVLAVLSPANTNLTASIQSPFGTLAGTLAFNYTGSGPAGSTITVTCNGTLSLYATTQVFTLATAGTPQFFPVNLGNCTFAGIAYTSGGATGVGFSMEFIFSPPGVSPPNTYTHIVGTTATVVKDGSGTLHGIVVGTSAAGTISIFDLGSAACTGTPVTNVVSVITEFASATPPPPPYLFDVHFGNGICLKASAAMDITVSAL